MENIKRNRFTFGIGTIGRDMVYSLISMYLIFYLTDILELPNATMWWITAILLIARIFDAMNDPVMGTIVDNTRTKYGKYKPWIAFGAFSSGIMTILLFTDLGLTGTAYIFFFAFIYLLWGMTYTTNDISYWSMMPALTTDQKEREKLGSIARICANIGLFAVVAGIVPLTTSLGNSFGSMKKAYFIFTLGVVAILWIGQSVTLFGVREPKGVFKPEPPTSLKDMVLVIFKNDQLLITAFSMVLFMVGYTATTGFGLYFFKYAYKNEGMYSIFALILGVSQIIALMVFPFISQKISRKKFYSIATFLVIAGYLGFFFSPMDMLFIGASGIFIFVGQAFIQILMLMFLTDTIEYGQWKLGKRNNSITLSLQPFINKMGGALGTSIVNATVILAGINDASKDPGLVTEEGLLMMKFSMLVIPLTLILIGFVIYLRKYKIDKNLYDRIISDLKERGDLGENA